MEPRKITLGPLQPRDTFTLMWSGEPVSVVLDDATFTLEGVTLHLHEMTELDYLVMSDPDVMDGA